MITDIQNNQEKQFENEVTNTAFLEGTSPLYKFDPEAPVAVRRVHPNNTLDTQAYSLMNEDPREIYGLSGISTPSDVDEEIRQTEALHSGSMSPAMQLAFIGDSNVPEKYRGMVLGMMGIFQHDPEMYKNLPFPKDALILSLVYQKRYFKWREDLNTQALIGDLSIEQSEERKDLAFAKELAQNSDFNDRDLQGVMQSGIKQGMQLVLEMERRLDQAEKGTPDGNPTKTPRKIIFIASIREGNFASKALIQKLNFTDSQEVVEEDGDTYRLYYHKVN